MESLPPLPPAGTGTFPAISGRKQQFENHVLRAGNDADIETLFCWHGFQYVRVSSVGATGFRGGLDDIVGLAINTNLTATGALAFGGDGAQGSVSDKAAAVLNGGLRLIGSCFLTYSHSRCKADMYTCTYPQIPR